MQFDSNERYWTGVMLVKTELMRRYSFGLKQFEIFDYD